MTSQPDPTRHEASPPHTFDGEPARVAVEMTLESMWVAQVRRLLAHYGLHADVSVDALVAVAAGAVPPAGAVADRDQLLRVTSSGPARGGDLMDELREGVSGALRDARWPDGSPVDDLTSRTIRDYLTPAVLAVVGPEVERLRAEVEHWKFHAEEAGQGFTQVCRDYARVSARNVDLVDRAEVAESRLAAVEALADDLSRVSGVLIDTTDDGEYETGKALEAVVDDLREALASVPAPDAGDPEPASEALAEAWDAGHAFTGFRPERGENPYRREEDAR